MMGLQREHPSLVPSNMNMSSNWNQAAGTGELEDGRISSRREGYQGGSPSDPLLSAGRFYPVQDNNDPEADDDSPISNSSALQASPFVQQQPFAAGSGLQSSTLAYNPVHATPTSLNLPSQERKRPPPSHPGHLLLHPGQYKERDEHGQQDEAGAAGLDRKQPYIINDPDPFISPHQSSLLATSFEDEGTPGASTTKRARTNTTEYYAPTGTPHPPPAAHLQPPSTGPYYSATWQQDDHSYHHHHHYGHPFEQYPPPVAVYNFGNEQHPHGLGMHPPPPPAMPHPPSVPPSPLGTQHHPQHARTSMTPPTILPRRGNPRPSSRAGAAAANRDPAVNLPRSARAARAGEATVQAVHPTEGELAECPTPRARQALETWYQRLTELHMFKNQYGNCNVPQQYPDNRQLGVW
jgi:Helicase associated domain